MGQDINQESRQMLITTRGRAIHIDTAPRNAVVVPIRQICLLKLTSMLMTEALCLQA